jgi:hypothetical protein
VPELFTDATAWPIQQFPPESVWKNRLDAWLRKGAGSWGEVRGTVVAAAAAVLSEASAAAGGWPAAPAGGAPLRLSVGGVGFGALLALNAAAAGALEPEVPGPLACAAALCPLLHENDEKLAAALDAPLVILPAKYDNMDRLQVGPRGWVWGGGGGGVGWGGGGVGGWGGGGCS